MNNYLLLSLFILFFTMMMISPTAKHYTKPGSRIAQLFENNSFLYIFEGNGQLIGKYVQLNTLIVLDAKDNTCELYQVPGIAETVNMDHIKYHYFASHGSINPTGIVPKGPEINFMVPHGRESIS